MHELKTAEDWWNLWAICSADVKDYNPNTTIQQILDHPLAAGRFGDTFMETIQEYQKLGLVTMSEVMDKMTESKDRRLWLVLESIWVDAPDSPSIHSWPSWHKFCDLCSEGGPLLYPEEENA